MQHAPDTPRRSITSRHGAEGRVQPATAASTTRARDLISPIGPTLWGTQSLEEAAYKLTAEHEAVVVLNLSAQPVGVITEADLELIRYQEPDTWRKKRCACMVREAERCIQLGFSLEDIIVLYQQGQICPLLVFDDNKVAGIVYPSTVFQWCAEHYPTALEALGESPRRVPEH